MKAPPELLQRYWALAQVGQRLGAAAGVRARPNRVGGMAIGPAALVVVVVKPLLAGTPSAQQGTGSGGSDITSSSRATERIAIEAPLCCAMSGNGPVPAAALVRLLGSPSLAYCGGTIVKWPLVWRWGWCWPQQRDILSATEQQQQLEVCSRER